MKNNNIPTLLAAFDDRLEATRAVHELESAGFDHDQIGFIIRGSDAVKGGMITDTVGAKDAKGAAVGAASGAVIGGLLGAASSLAIPGIGPIVAAGIFSATIGGAAAGTAVGGIIGAMTGLNISEEEAEYYEHKFRIGKAIVAVKAYDRASEAEGILRHHGGYNLRFSKNEPVPTAGAFSKP